MSSYIREPLSGKALAYLDGKYVRNQRGEVLVSIDGNCVREGVSGGLVLASLDGKFIREGASGGNVIASISGEYIREGASGGQVMYGVDSYLSDIEKCALTVAVLEK